MAKSPAFQYNSELVIDVVESIPSGRCTTYGTIGEAIGIVPRYVALIMTTAPDIQFTNWHRVVGKDATVKPGSHRSEQLRRLMSEGVDFDGYRIVDFATLLWIPKSLTD